MANWPLNLGTAVLTGVVYELGWDLTFVIHLGSALSLVVIGAAIGLAQWAVLHQRLPLSAGWWVAVTAVSWVIPLLPGFLVGGTGMGLTFALGVILGLATGAVVGGLQWLILRQHLPQASWWVLANAVGWLMCGAFAPAAIILTSIMTGLTLQWLLYQSRSQPQPGIAQATPALAPQTPAWLREIQAGRSPQLARPRSKGLLVKVPTFSETLQTWWRASLTPTLTTFQQKKARSNLATALVWMTAVGLINGMMMVLVLLLTYYFLFDKVLPSFFGETDLTRLQSLLGEFVVFAALFNGLASVFIAPFSLLIVSAILFIIARLFGGEGDFQVQTYLIATFYAPFHLLSGTIGLIPLLGALVTLPLFFYQVIPGRYAIQASHPNLTSKQAWYVVLIPVGAVVAFWGFFLVVWFLLALRPMLLRGS